MKALYGTPLKRFLRDYRRAHPPARQVAFLLQSVAYPVNVGSIFRIADACGAAPVILSGITPQPPHPTISKVARGKESRVPWEYVESPEEAVAKLKRQGFYVCALELTDDCQPYHTVPWPAKTCLVVGHEDHGITESTLALCDGAAFVPMLGKGRSLNVHVSLAVVAFHILNTAPA
ncbi:MAG: RNA methyltransferase [Chloroflexi bacterium]|nr:RNA methyltransferase [Chloroflexota bacterium]